MLGKVQEQSEYEYSACKGAGDRGNIRTELYNCARQKEYQNSGVRDGEARGTLLVLVQEGTGIEEQSW